MTVQLHEQILDYFTYVDEVQGSIDLAAVRHQEFDAPTDAVHVTPDNSVRRRRALLVAMATFVAVILAVVLPLLLTRSADPPVVDTVPPTTITPTVESLYELDWTLVEGSAATPEFLRQQIVATPTGLLIVNDGSTTRDTILRSLDGQEWVEEPMPGELLGFAEIHQLDDIFLMVGERGERVLSSSDGASWTERSTDGWPDLWLVTYRGIDIETLPNLILPWTATNRNERDRWVIGIDGRFLAFETWSTAEGVRSAFTSVDGLEWQPIATPQFDEMNLGNSIAFAVRDDVLIASGYVQQGENRWTRLLRTTDGLVWTDVTTEADVERAQGIRAADSGWIAGGYLPGNQVVSSRLYFSADGLDWVEIIVANDPFSSVHTHVAVAGNTLIRWDDDGFRPHYQIASLETLELR